MPNLQFQITGHQTVRHPNFHVRKIIDTALRLIISMSTTESIISFPSIIFLFFLCNHTPGIILFLSFHQISTHTTILRLSFKSDSSLLVMSMGWDHISELWPPTGLLFISQEIYEYGEPWWNDVNRGKLLIHPPFCSNKPWNMLQNCRQYALSRSL
jgi:hypothetical protein